MKKIAVFMFITILFPVLATAQTLHNMKTATVGWDAVTPGICTCSAPPCAVTEACPVIGQPARGAIKYKVYSSNNMLDQVGVAISGEIDPTQLLVSIPENTPVYLGVESIFWPAGGGSSLKSAQKAWSYNASDCADGVTFGFLYKLPVIPPPPPATAGGMRTLIP